jgi:hypothetical protein
VSDKNAKKKKVWFCLLYGKDIAEGKCLDINYERLGYLNDGCLGEVERVTGLREPKISGTCVICPNLPADLSLGEVSR